MVERTGGGRRLRMGSRRDMDRNAVNGALGATAFTAFTIAMLAVQGRLPEMKSLILIMTFAMVAVFLGAWTAITTPSGPVSSKGRCRRSPTGRWSCHGRVRFRRSVDRSEARPSTARRSRPKFLSGRPAELSWTRLSRRTRSLGQMRGEGGVGCSSAIAQRLKVPERGRTGIGRAYPMTTGSIGFQTDNSRFISLSGGYSLRDYFGGTRSNYEGGIGLRPAPPSL